MKRNADETLAVTLLAVMLIDAIDREDAERLTHLLAYPDFDYLFRDQPSILALAAQARAHFKAIQSARLN